MSRTKNITRQQKLILNQLFDKYELLALTCSDREILTLFNGQLAESKTLPVDAFIRYRAGNADQDYQQYDTIFEHIGNLIDVMHVHQKMELVERIKDEGSHWQKWKWLIELREDKTADNTNVSQTVDWSNYKLGMTFS